MAKNITQALFRGAKVGEFSADAARKPTRSEAERNVPEEVRVAEAKAGLDRYMAQRKARKGRI